MNNEYFSHLIALALQLEGEGQYNHAKLLRAAVESLMTRSASQLGLSNDRSQLLAETDWAIQTLEASDIDPGLVNALHQARAVFSEGRLSNYVETPDPFVCRACGNLAMDDTAACPVCGSQPVTFKRFRPIYWLDALDPFTAQIHLRATPEKVAVLLDSLLDMQPSPPSSDGGWSLHQAVSHLRDAQGVLAFRVNLMLNHENPLLESKAVFEWATNQEDQPVALGEIFEAYRTSRASTIASLEKLPLLDWWRRGQHEEFGQLRLYQEVSYFTCHELTHLPQLESLVKHNLASG
jgi:hypothetical protein